MPRAEKGQRFGGRVKGTPNKFTKELKNMILGALEDVGGQAYLAEQAKKNPTAFMALIGKVLPKDINANVNVMDSLADRIREARERVGR